MYSIVKHLILSILLMLYFYGPGQTNNEPNVKKSFILPKNHVYKKHIKTVILQQEMLEGSLPIINMRSNEKLLLSFDDLQADIKNYQYTVEAYNYNWTPSVLKPYEYLEGYQTDLIEENESSLGTDYPYTHYYIRIPTEYLEITKSGNYLLQVYQDELSYENTILSWRMMFLDPKVSVTGKIKKAMTTAEEQGYNQMLEITIDLGNNYLINPSQNISLVVLQNSRWDNARFGIKPTTLIGNKAEFYNNEELIFKSGNEYRNFDFKDFKYHTDEIKAIESTPMGYEVTLKKDKRRTFQQYYSEQDRNGSFMIRTSNGRTPSYEADYAEVNFFLSYDYPVGIGDIFLLGQLSNGEISPGYKMTYNFQKKAYEKTLLLKQGYYDYLYGFVEKGSSHADASFIEGNYIDTENEYTILVYYNEPGSNYDQLIGMGMIRK